MKFKTLAMSLLAVIALASCSSKKTVLPYFTDLDGRTSGTLPKMDYMPVIEPDDELVISVTSPNPEATAIYNLPFSNPALRSSLIMASSATQQTYIVSTNGDITLPVIGRMHVAGKNIEQVADELEAIVRKDVPDASVAVKMTGFMVNVGGEVSSPRRIKVTSNRYSILDAISEAGDLTPFGERSNVLVIREENGQRVYGRVNLNSAESLNSPFYYLKQNDYIYVEPNEIRESNARYNQNNSYKLQVTSTVVSAASVIASLVIALTIK